MKLKIQGRLFRFEDVVDAVDAVEKEGGVWTGSSTASESVNDIGRLKILNWIFKRQPRLNFFLR